MRYNSTITRCFVGTWFFLLPILAFNQIRIDTIKSEERPDELYFPLIRHPKAVVAQKINNYLQSNLLGNTTKKTPASGLFDRTKHILNDSMNRSGTSYCSFTPVLNTQKILSIQFDLEYTGAYPSPGSRYFNFNSQNGEPIFVQDLFTNAGLDALKKRINSEREKRIKNYIEEIKKDKNEDLLNDLDYIHETLKGCLEYDTLEGFILAKNKIIFNRANCFPHMVQVYMPDLDVELTFAELSSWFNDFGKKALVMNNASIEKEFKPGIMKPFYGTIGGKFAIVLQFSDIYNEKSLSGFYYYESQGICVSLSGSIAGSDVFIEETDDDGNTVATFKGTYDGKQITGTWTPSKTGKALSFTLKN